MTGFFIAKNFNLKVKNKEIEKYNLNQFIKAKNLGKEKPCLSKETKFKMGSGNRGVIRSSEFKRRHSYIMSEVAKNKPEVYSNKQKRIIEEYKGCKFDSKWELEVAKFFDNLGFKWVRPKKPFAYYWNNGTHFYYPDFYLPEKNIYIEVKGYEVERDKYKWAAVPNLIVLKEKEIKLIRLGDFNLI